MISTINRKPRKFRAFITAQYWENRDEYHSVGQPQPYTFEDYVSQNISALKEKYRLTLRKNGSTV